jgi:hypothetical protein
MYQLLLLDDGSSFPPPVFFSVPPPTYNEESSQQTNRETSVLANPGINGSILSEPPSYTSQISLPWIYNSIKHQQVSDAKCQETSLTEHDEQERVKTDLGSNMTKTNQVVEDAETKQEVQK